MVAFVESEIKLNQPQGDKATLRHHLTVVWEKTGKQPQQLIDAKPLPQAGAHLWRWFMDMNAMRNNNGVTESLLSARDLIDWCWFSGQSLELWERRAIRAMDIAWVRGRND